MNIVKSVDQGIDKLTSWILVFVMLSILVLSCGSIFLRWMHTTVIWIEPLVRHLVFLSAFLGGILATGRGTHIGIDLISKFLEAKKWHHALRFVSRLIYLTCILTLFWLIKAGFDYVQVESEFGNEVFWGINSGKLGWIIPVGFGMIAIRYFLLFILSFSNGQEEV